MFPKLALLAIRMYLPVLTIVRRPSVTPDVHHAQVLLQQDDLRCRLGHVRGAVYGDANIRRMQRRGVVDAVAEKAHRLAHTLQRHDHPQLLLRRDATEQPRFAQTPDQRFVGECGQFRSGEYLSGIEAEFAAKMPRHLLVVAGQHLHRHAGRSEFGKGRAGGGLGRVEEHSEAGKGQSLLVGQHGCCLIRRLYAAGDAKQPETLGA